MSKRSRALAAFHGIYLLKLSRLSFSKNLSCYADTDSGSYQDYVPKVASISSDNSAAGTGTAETACTICTPFFKKWPVVTTHTIASVEDSLGWVLCWADLNL